MPPPPPARGCIPPGRHTKVETQLRSYIEDGVRSAFPRKTLDQSYEIKDELAKWLKDDLQEKMNAFGYEIVQTLLTDLSPEDSVKHAMNEINTQRRLKEAAVSKAEAEFVLSVKAAEANAERMYLQGHGLGRQRQAIAAGLAESGASFVKAVPGTSAMDVMVFTVQEMYCDTLKTVGNSAKRSVFY